jgi:hypothetical protein
VIAAEMLEIAQPLVAWSVRKKAAGPLESNTKRKGRDKEGCPDDLPAKKAGALAGHFLRNHVVTRICVILAGCRE